MKLGNAFNLYLKYPEEFDYFCCEREDDDEVDLSWLKKNDRDKFKRDCDKAHDEAEEDFKQLADGMAKLMRDRFAKLHFGKIFIGQWEWRMYFHPAGTKKPYHSQVGVWLATTDDGKAKACPWIWVSGGRAGEEQLRTLLGLSKHPENSEFSFEPGSIPLAEITLAPKNGLDSGDFINKIMEPLLKISENKWRKIWELSQGNGA